MGVQVRLMALEREEGRVLSWLVCEYQRQARVPRALDEVEREVRLRRGRMRELLEQSATLAQIVSLRQSRDGLRLWLTSEGYADALNLLAERPGAK